MINSRYLFNWYLITGPLLIISSSSSTCHWHLHHDQDLPQGSGKVDLFPKCNVLMFLLGRKKTHQSISVLAPPRSKVTDRSYVSSSKNRSPRILLTYSSWRLLEFGEARPAMDPKYISRQNHEATDTDWGADALVTPAMGGRGVGFDGEGE